MLLLGFGEDAAEIHKYCNKEDVQDRFKESVGRVLSLRFHSGKSAPGKGFKIHYSFHEANAGNLVLLILTKLHLFLETSIYPAKKMNFCWKHEYYDIKFFCPDAVLPQFVDIFVCKTLYTDLYRVIVLL